jgi:NAD(P)-dependent dehydrogenase (short-subunit alcohol dehydrogenase family)
VVAAFAGAGARVAAVDLDPASAEAAIAALPGGPHLAIGMDVRILAAHEPTFARVAAAFGRFDVLVDAAAVLVRRDSIEEVTEADWDLQHDVNLKAAFFLNRAAAREMRKGGRGGRIINFTSQGFWTGGYGGSVVYAATKGGIVSMTRGLARSLAKDRITVNAVSPGAADTAMLRSGMSEEALEAIRVQIPLGYMAAPGEVSGAVVFLASDHASYITGATINVSGGWLMY